MIRTALAAERRQPMDSRGLACCGEAHRALELKAVKALDRVHMAQSINYLKATGLCVCLLLNFGKPRLEIQRISN